MIIHKKQLIFPFFLMIGLFSYIPPSHAMFPIYRLFFGIFGYDKNHEKPKQEEKNPTNFSQNDYFGYQEDDWQQQYGKFVEKENKREAKKFPEKNIAVGSNFIKAKIRNYKGKEIAQLPVLSQFKVNGGGGASCGYQTVKNGIITTLALLRKDVSHYVKTVALKKDLQEELPKNLGTKLNDVGLVQQFFGPICSSWRKQIVLRRNADKLEKVLRPLWQRCVCDPEKIVDPTSRLNKYKVAKFYSMVLSGLATDVSKEVVFWQKKFSFDQDDSQKRLLEICRESCRKKSQDDINEYYTKLANTKTKDDLSRRLCKKGRLAKYIDFEELKKIVVSPSNYPTLIENNKKLIKNSAGLGSRSRNGDWLDPEEIKMLIELEKKKGMLSGVNNVSWLVYDDLSLLGRAGFDPNEEEFKKAVNKTITDPNHKVVFCIGTMNNSTNDLSGSFGHWFPLVCSLKDKKVHYYTMDSLGNKCRLEDKHVIKIIDTFKKTREMVSSVKIIAQGSMGHTWHNRVTASVLALQQTGLSSKK